MGSEKTETKCPFTRGAAGTGTTNRDWWPEQLRVDLLHQHSSKSGSPYITRKKSRFENGWTRILAA